MRPIHSVSRWWANAALLLFAMSACTGETIV
ncbi:MAG: hypothetical protein JWM10_3181, partial [Myxococcaceae bacterium]|nr:hypothetical protein [Myxococcaceae bacterium]